MRANWIKIAFFVLAAVMLASIAQVMLDPGLGTADESRRTKHPSGFSMIPPRGWGASVFYGNGPEGGGALRISPEHVVGWQPSITVSRSAAKAPGRDDAVPYTFQGKPATLSVFSSKRAWDWRVDFQRDDAWFRIVVEVPVRTELERGPLWPFINSFRVERPFSLTGTTTVPTTLTTILPATEPASR